MSGAARILFSQADIAARVETVAAEIAASPVRPEFMAPVLIGGFVFAADLLRALVRQGLSLSTEFLWLRSYDGRQDSDAIQVLTGPSPAVRGRTVLIVDGVLDRGRTDATARKLLLEAGAHAVMTAVAVDKLRPSAIARADFALFSGVSGFIVGYGMDDCGNDRGLPHIAVIE